MSLRVLVVDDSVVFRQAVSEALSGIPGVEVVGTAANGRLALSRLAALQPDLMTLDIEMPDMNGIEVLETMHLAGPKTSVLVLTCLTPRGGELTVRALELGAIDFLTKPEAADPQSSVRLLRAQLMPLLREFERRSAPRAPARVERTPSPARPVVAPPARPKAPVRQGAPIVLIGVSTGGPAALSRVLPALPANLNAPVLVVQHMPRTFTGPLAASLASRCSIPVGEAVDGEPALAGRVYLAPGGSQMKVEKGERGDIVIRVTSDPPENNCRPAADYLFRSAASHFPGRSIAAILTGMGADGTAGLRLLKQGGCVSIAQDEATCVVFGMPREAIQAGMADQVLPLESIAGAIVRAVKEALP